MRLRNSPDRFGLIHKSFHWIMALIILGMLSVGFFMTEMEPSPDKLKVYALHKSFGLLILFLVFLRVFWRIFDRRPEQVASVKWWERALSHIVHFALYALMIILPLTGWVMSSAGDFPVQFFGFFEMPLLTEKNEETFEFLRDIHGMWAFVLLGVLALHFAGAFKHHFIDGDATLKRMTSMKLGLFGGLALAGIAGALWAAPLFLAVNDDLAESVSEAREETMEAEADVVLEEEKAGMMWDVDEKESFIRFSVAQYGTPFEGEFKKFDSVIVFDPDNLPGSAVLVEIDISSLETGSGDRDRQAMDADWFDEKNHDKAVFRADSFEQTGPGQYIAHGFLSLRGAERPLALPFALDIAGGEQETAQMKAEIALNRLDFGIGQGQWQNTDAIGGTVTLTIYVKAEKKR